MWNWCDAVPSARRVRARHVRERRPHLIAAAGHQIVHVADRGGVDVDQNLVGSWTGLGPLAEGQRLYAIERVAKNGAHI